MAAGSVIFLAGAPESHTLDWSTEHLAHDFDPPLRRFIGLQHDGRDPCPTQSRASWRLLPLGHDLFYQSPILQRHYRESDTRKNIPYVHVEQDDDFLEHSFAVHADIQSSQLAPHSSIDEHESEISTFITENSILSTYIDGSIILPPDSSLPDTSKLTTPAGKESHLRFTGPVMSINSIPTADYLSRLQPQTMTVNLLAGIINIAPARTVRVRRGDYDMDIVEITLGDDTKAGFTISSWHTPVTSQKGPDHLREILNSLRPQDIVLVEQVALSSFRGQVFGQSLNQRVSKNATRITVLCKSELLRAAETASPHTQLLSSHVAGKLQRVKDWVASFIGPANRHRPDLGKEFGGPKHAARKRKHAALEEYLPPDSQP